MRMDRIKVLKPFDLIDVDNGNPVSMSVGTTAFLVPESKNERGYYLIEGTRTGAIAIHFDSLERDGKINVTRIAEDSDPTLDGIPLPITSASQLTEWQRNHLVCGHLVGGKFLCEKCTLKKGLIYPNAIAVYPVNILPYSQACSKCKLLIFDIWKSKKGGPLSLFV